MGWPEAFLHSMQALATATVFVGFFWAMSRY